VTYLQGHYGINDAHVYTHHYVQPSDRSDPVAFDWNKFAYDRTALGNSETAFNR
jgi:N-acetyl-anhydromuramyl-L-alanine amidase AmpD